MIHFYLFIENNENLELVFYENMWWVAHKIYESINILASKISDTKIKIANIKYIKCPNYLPLRRQTVEVWSWKFEIVFSWGEQ